MILYILVNYVFNDETRASSRSICNLVPKDFVFVISESLEELIKKDAAKGNILSKIWAKSNKEVQKPDKVKVQSVAKTIGRALLRKKSLKRKSSLIEKKEVELDLEEVNLQKLAFRLGEMLLQIFEKATKIIKIEKTKKWSGENEVTVNVEKR